MPSVRLESVGKRFGDVTAVNNVTLEVEDGGFLTLLGHSGCGKTTTLRMLAGLEQNDSGRILIGDKVVSDAERSFFVPPEKRELGMVFQSYAIWPHMTVFENVAYPLSVRRRPKAEIQTRVKETLETLKIAHLADRPATALSGGQQQRVAIARALVLTPAVLLMDEPLSNLDAALRAHMRAELRSLQQRVGITTVYVTHDQEEAMALSDKIAVMHEGNVLQFGSPEEIYLRPANRTVAAFFGSPVLLAGKIDGIEERLNGKVRAHVQGEGWSAHCYGPESLQVGQAVELPIRAEILQVNREEPARNERQTVWPGRVTSVTFRGASRDLSVRTEHGEFRVEVPPEEVYSIDETVFLSTIPERLWAVPV